MWQLDVSPSGSYSRPRSHGAISWCASRVQRLRRRLLRSRAGHAYRRGRASAACGTTTHSDGRARRRKTRIASLQRQFLCLNLGGAVLATGLWLLMLAVFNPQLLRPSDPALSCHELVGQQTTAHRREMWHRLACDSRLGFDGRALEAAVASRSSTERLHRPDGAVWQVEEGGTATDTDTDGARRVSAGSPSPQMPALLHPAASSQWAPAQAPLSSWKDQKSTAAPTVVAVVTASRALPGGAAASNGDATKLVLVQRLLSSVAVTLDRQPSESKLPGEASGQDEFVYWLVVAYDAGDPVLDTYWGQRQLRDWFKVNVQSPVARRGVSVSLNLVRFDNPAQQPGPAFNFALRCAYEDGADYLYRVNDDTWFATADWASRLVHTLRAMRPPNFGVVGPHCDADSARVLSHDMTHRSHLQRFAPHYYPPVFVNYWLDDWITAVYGGLEAQSASTVLTNDDTENHTPDYHEAGAGVWTETRDVPPTDISDPGAGAVNSPQTGNRRAIEPPRATSLSVPTRALRVPDVVVLHDASNRRYSIQAHPRRQLDLEVVLGMDTLLRWLVQRLERSRDGYPGAAAQEILERAIDDVHVLRHVAKTRLRHCSSVESRGCNSAGRAGPATAVPVAPALA